MVCIAGFNAVTPLNLQLVAKEIPDVRNIRTPDCPSLNQLLLCKLATRLHRFPLLGLQTFATIYRLSRTELDSDAYLLNQPHSISAISKINDFTR